MNCDQFQQLLFEYAEGSMSRGMANAADAHLAGCADCREHLARVQQGQRSLDNAMRRATESLTLSPGFHDRLVAALSQTNFRRPATTPWWMRIAWGAGIAAVCAFTACLMLGIPFGSRPPSQAVIPKSAPVGGPPAVLSLELSYCAPTYIFHREGNLVTDSLTCTPRTIEQTLVVYQNVRSEKPRL